MGGASVNPTQRKFLDRYVAIGRAKVEPKPLPVGKDQFGNDRRAVALAGEVQMFYATFDTRLKGVGEIKDPGRRASALLDLDRDTEAVAERFEDYIQNDPTALPGGIVKPARRKIAEMRKGLALAKQDVQDKLGLNVLARDLAGEVAKLWSRYEMRIAGLTTGTLDDDPRDVFLTLEWLEGELGPIAKDFEKNKAFVAENAGETIANRAQIRIDTMRNGIIKARQGVAKALAESVATKVKTEWPGRVKLAESLSGPKLIEEIEGLEHEQALLREQLELFDLPGSLADGLDVTALRKKWDESLPEFTATATPEKPKEEKAPTLTMSDEDCRKLYKAYGDSWSNLKKAYRTDAFCEKAEVAKGKGEEVMWQLWAYRKKIVDAKVLELQNKYGLEPSPKGWIAVGSTNLESDYDITILQHGGLDTGKKDKEGKPIRDIVQDRQIVLEFNTYFQSEFGTQPGAIFDTNLYASAPPQQKLSAISDTPAGKAMLAMASSGQDVGALMKQRRFMSWEEYEDYMHEVLDAMKKDGAAPEDIALTRNQFEEADNHYLMSLRRMLLTAEKQLDGIKDPTEAQKKALEIVSTALDASAEGFSAKSQKALAAGIAHLEHDHADILLGVNNALYVEALEEVRFLEAQAAECARDIEGIKNSELKAEVQREMEGLIARARTLYSDAIYYANEAYLSDGPVKHIVDATQGAKSGAQQKVKEKNGDWDKLEPEEQKKLISEEVTERRGKLTLQDCLQSFNEQLGDFVKDTKHYSTEDLPGTGFFRSAKYLTRLIDAVDLLIARTAEKNVPFDGDLPGIGKLTALKARVDNGILALRKGELSITKDSATPEEIEEQKQAFAIREVSEMFKVKSLDALGKLFVSYGVKVNAQLRSAVAKEMSAAAGDSKAYFGG